MLACPPEVNFNSGLSTIVRVHWVILIAVEPSSLVQRFLKSSSRVQAPFRQLRALRQAQCGGGG
jgi:hypothetical protein